MDCEQWRIVDRGSPQELPRSLPHAFAATAAGCGPAVALEGADLLGEEVIQVAPSHVWPLKA